MWKLNDKETITRSSEVLGILNFSSFKTDTLWGVVGGFGLNINNVFAVNSLKGSGKQ